jgi:hypothetical protein
LRFSASYLHCSSDCTKMNVSLHDCSVTEWVERYSGALKK